MGPKRYLYMLRLLWACVLASIILFGLLQHRLFDAPLAWVIVSCLLVLMPGLFGDLSDPDSYPPILIWTAVCVIGGLTVLGNTGTDAPLSWLLSTTLGAVLLARLLRPRLEWLHDWLEERHRNLHFDVHIYDEQGEELTPLLVTADYPDGRRRQVKGDYCIELPLADGPLTLTILEEPTPAALPAVASPSTPVVLAALSGQDVVELERRAPGVFALRVVYNRVAYLDVCLHDEHEEPLCEALVVACYPQGRRYCLSTGPSGDDVRLPLPAAGETLALYAASPAQVASADQDIEALADRLVRNEPITCVVGDPEGGGSLLEINLYDLGDGHFVDQHEFCARLAQDAGRRER